MQRNRIDVGGQAMTKEQAINKVISIAENEVGYLEKASNNKLDSKTENAGSANYTKYWRDIKPEYQGEPWCACFVTWCFVQAFGKEEAAQLLRHYPYVYCPSMESMFILNSNPKRSDIVIFKRKGTFVHTGIVTHVNGDYFETIEGNTSGGNTIIANGGGVFKKSYYNSNLPGTKFVTVDWDMVSNDNADYWADKYFEKLFQKKVISDVSIWKNYKAKVSKSQVIAVLDKLTGGVWYSDEADNKKHWSQQHVYSLCGKGVIVNKEIYLSSPDKPITKAQLLALVAKIVNNGSKELSKYEHTPNDHWGRNYLNYLCDKSVINTPSVWCDNFEGIVLIENFMALVCKVFNL